MPADYLDLPTVLPVVPLSDVVVFPSTVFPAVVTSPRALAALEVAAESKEKKAFFAFSPASKEGKSPNERAFHARGTVGDILEFTRIHDSAARVLIEGQSEAELVEVEHHEELSRGHVRRLDLPWRRDKETAAARRAVVSQFRHYCGLVESIPDEIADTVAELENPLHVAWHVATHLRVPPETKYRVLDEPSVTAKLHLLLQVIRAENDIREIENRILEEAKSQIGRNQREYFLNEQLKAIERELGVSEDDNELAELHDRLDKVKLSEEARERVERELRRLERMPPISPEATVSRTYVETILDLPWGVTTADNTDLAYAERVLDEDHHGLERVKERLIEYLAVVREVGAIRGPILCLVGPPGVGKTSVARSVARALGRNFLRIALGGVRDEAEIRGHRRTYIGSLPGKIVQSLRRAGSMNPVFLLDEVDKLSSDYRGDPSSALLEVLDPEQNSTFQDHYLEVDFDLSKVLFITTANYQGAIPAPLLDRMEIIRLHGYTEDEKVAIAKKFLLPKRAVEHGMKAKQLAVGDPALRFMIQGYTREAGVRDLDRRVSELCRKTVRKRVAADDAKAEAHVKAAKEKAAKSGKSTEMSDIDTQEMPAIAAGMKAARSRAKRTTLSKAKVREMLGTPRYRDTELNKKPEVGVATGLAWTEVGGELLPVETLVMTGQGKISLTLTGKLGDVLQESARAALAYIRRHADKLGVPEKFYLDTDLHVHLPEGAIPKDGPSAGVALLTSMVSALSGRRARQDVAMTGEITLRGGVLRIGGLKEKALAARRHGVKTVLLPDANRDDLDELPKEVRDAMEFVPIKTVGEALAILLADDAPKRKPRARSGGSRSAATKAEKSKTGGKGTTRPAAKSRRRAPGSRSDRPTAGS